MSSQIELATFGAGCFWSVEARFRALEGVLDATSGYMGGQPDPITSRSVRERPGMRKLFKSV